MTAHSLFPIPPWLGDNNQEPDAAPWEPDPPPEDVHAADENDAAYSPDHDPVWAPGHQWYDPYVIGTSQQAPLPPTPRPKSATDPPVLVQWHAQVDSCPVCIANMEVGAIPEGAYFPSGDTEPPAHPHCQCELLRGYHDLFDPGNGWIYDGQPGTGDVPTIPGVPDLPDVPFGRTH